MGTPGVLAGLQALVHAELLGELGAGFARRRRHHCACPFRQLRKHGTPIPTNDMRLAALVLARTRARIGQRLERCGEPELATLKRVLQRGRVFSPWRESLRWLPIASRPRRSSNSRTSTNPASDVTRDP
jgi:hypothetical protein